MNITRQTKLYRSFTQTGVSVVWKTLTITQLKVIDSIKSNFNKAEIAFEFGYISGDTDINFFIKEQIGKSVIDMSALLVRNEQLMEFTVDDFRKEVGMDMVIDIMQIIMNAVPSTTFEYLTSLTYNDILELGVIVEKMTQKQVFNFDTTDTDVDIKDEHAFFNEDGKSLQDKMKESMDF